MRGKARQILHGAALCVPGCVIVCLTVLAMWYFVPRCEVQEAAEWEEGCGAVAKELKAGEGVRDYVGMVPAAWMEGKSVRGKRGEVGGAEWGHFARSEAEEFVWCRVGDFLVGRFVEGFCLSSFVYWMCGLGGVVMGLAVVLSVMLVRAFVGADQERIDFMRMVAHDLASPLVGVRMLVGKDDEAARNLNEQALGMVENFRAFAQMNVRPMPKFGKVDLRKVYEDAYKIFREDYRDCFGGEDVEVKVGAGAADFVAWADETMVGQIIWNLLGNDLKYAAPYGKVRVEFEGAADFVVVRFVDDGPGMSVREMRRAFGRYYRARSAVAGRASGYGIGLATGRGAARAMGGDLVVRGNVPRGCIFELRLARAKEG
jgi:hypothetical protein